MPIGLMMVEQPVPGTDLTGMTVVTQAVEPVVLADQGVESSAEVFQLAAANGAKAVSIKLLKFGGLQKSLAAARVCEAAGLICHVGGMATSRLIDAAQAHFISATPSASSCRLKSVNLRRWRAIWSKAWRLSMAMFECPPTTASA